MSRALNDVASAWGNRSPMTRCSRRYTASAWVRPDRRLLAPHSGVLRQARCLVNAGGDAIREGALEKGATRARRMTPSPGFVILTKRSGPGARVIAHPTGCRPAAVFFPTGQEAVERAAAMTRDSTERRDRASIC